MVRSIGAICNVAEWMRYRAHLSAGWMSDARRLAKEAIWRENHRRAQRGRWMWL